MSDAGHPVLDVTDAVRRDLLAGADDLYMALVAVQSDLRALDPGPVREAAVDLTASGAMVIELMQGYAALDALPLADIEAFLKHLSSTRDVAWAAQQDYAAAVLEGIGRRYVPMRQAGVAFFILNNPAIDGGPVH